MNFYNRNEKLTERYFTEECQRLLTMKKFGTGGNENVENIDFSAAIKNEERIDLLKELQGEKDDKTISLIQDKPRINLQGKKHHSSSKGAHGKKSSSLPKKKEARNTSKPINIKIKNILNINLHMHSKAREDTCEHQTFTHTRIRTHTCTKHLLSAPTANPLLQSQTQCRP